MGQRVGGGVQDVVPSVPGLLVVPPEPGGGLPPVPRSCRFAGDGSGQPPLLGLGVLQVPRRGDARCLGAVGRGSHGQVVQTTVHTQEPGSFYQLLVVPLGLVQVGGFHVEADEPAARAPGHGREQDPAAASGDEAPQPAGVVVDLHRAGTGQGHRPGSVAVTDADRRLAALGVLVAQSERLDGPSLALEPGEPDPPPGPVALAGRGERRQPLAEIDGCFLEDLLAHLRAPRQAGHLHLGRPGAVNHEQPSRVLGLLPRVERVDQVEPGPGHLHAGISLFGGERVLDQPQARVAREPGRTGMAGQRRVLLDRGVEAEPERRVPHEHRQPHTPDKPVERAC